MIILSILKEKVKNIQISNLAHFGLFNVQSYIKVMSVKNVKKA